MARVVLSSNTSWYLYNYRRNTIRALRREGHEVFCVAPRDDYSDRFEAELEAQFVQLDMDNQGSNPLRDLALVLRFIGIYRKLRPQAIFHFTIKNNVYGTFAASLLGIPAINNISGLGTAFIHPGWVGKIVRMLYRLSQPLARQVFCQNREDEKLLVEKGLVSRRKLTLLPGSGVDLQRFRPSTAERGDHGFRFLYIGRMLYDKGIEELVSAFAEVKQEQDCELWLAGFSDALNNSAIGSAQLEAWQQEVGLRWLGPTDKPEDLIAQADCVVLPSYREGLPRALLEANAMEVPVITTDVPGCRSVVEDGVNGLLCTPRSVESLKQALLAMIRMEPGKRAGMGLAGRERVSRDFSESVVIHRYLAALHDCSG